MNVSDFHPLPEQTADSAPYWAALRKHRLVFQQCAACGKVRHYPRPLCDRCYNEEVTWRESEGVGIVESWIVAHHAFHPAFGHRTPYVLVTVAMAEGVRVLGPWYGDLASLRLGLPVSVMFDDVTPELTVPAFQPA